LTTKNNVEELMKERENVLASVKDKSSVSTLDMSKKLANALATKQKEQKVSSTVSKKTEAKNKKNVKVKETTKETTDNTQKREVVTYKVVETTLNAKDLSKFENKTRVALRVSDSDYKIFMSEDKTHHVTCYFNEATQQYEKLTKEIMMQLLAREIERAKVQLADKAVDCTEHSTKCIILDTQYLYTHCNTISSCYGNFIRSYAQKVQRKDFAVVKQANDRNRNRFYYHVKLA
jgi:hypothetical protein